MINFLWDNGACFSLFLVETVAQNRVPFSESVKKNLYFLYEAKAFNLIEEAHLIFKGSIYLGVFFIKMAAL